jgi:hypothetical protein
VKPQSLRGESGPCPDNALIYTPPFALQLRKNHGKTSVGQSEKRLTEYCCARLVWSTWWRVYGRPRPACWQSPPLACVLGSLGQPSVRYVPSCLNKGFLARGNFESKLLVRVLMWSQRMQLPSYREFAYYL